MQRTAGRAFEYVGKVEQIVVAERGNGGTDLSKPLHGVRIADG